MAQDPDLDQVAGALRVSIGLLVRRLRQVQAEGELTLPETSALARLDRGGPATPSALAKLEQISPQSMGATLGALEGRGPGAGSVHGVHPLGAQRADGGRPTARATGSESLTVQAHGSRGSGTISSKRYPKLM